MNKEGPAQFTNEPYKGRYVVVEVGGRGGVPSDASLLNEIYVDPKMKPLYLGIDKDRDMLDSIPHDDAPSAAMLEEDFLSADFLKSTELDGSVDRLVIFNVLTSSIRPKPKDFPELFLKKISRMLKPGGKALVGEWYTPQFAPNLAQIDLKELGMTATWVLLPDDVKKPLDDMGVSPEKIRGIVAHFWLSIGEGVTPFMLVLEKESST